MGSGSQQTTKTDNSPWAPQQSYLKVGFKGAKDIYDQGPKAYFPGQTYTDMSPYRTQGLEGAANIATGGNPLVDNASGYVADTLGGDSDNPYASILQSGTQGMQSTANGDFLANNPFLDRTFDAANSKLTHSFETNTLPAIAAGLGMSGNAGSTTSDLLGAEAARGLTDAQGSLAASIYGGNYQQERDRQTAAQAGLTNTGTNLYGTGVSERMGLAGMAPVLREAQYGDATKLQGVGSEFETQAAKSIEEDINRYNYNQNAAQSALQDYMAMISGSYGSTSTSRSSTGSNPLQQIAGLGLAGAGLFSDRRLKDVIAHVATADNGAKLYLFRYTTHAVKDFGMPSAVQVGPLAQEVAEIVPEAVYEHPSGYLMVDYGKALTTKKAA
jgi:hypothetical protein